MKNRIAFSFFGLLLFGILSYSFFWESSEPATPATNMAAPIPTGVFRGSVATHLFFSSTNREVYLPEVDVIVRDINTNNIINQTTTDESGGYISGIVEMGTYLLCMEKSGFQNICLKVTLSEPEHNPGVQILPLQGDDFIYGTVKLEDGSVGFFRQNYYGIDFYTDVTISTTGDKFRCNTSGEYVIPYQAQGRAKLTAKCENASVVKSISAGVNVKHLILPNNSPLAGELFFHENGSEVHRTVPGAKLKVIGDVSDPDGDPLTHRWFPWGEHPGFSSSNSNNVSWTLPSGGGTYSMALVVTDGLGGISIKKKTIRAVDRRVLFSGTVRSLGTNGPVSDAQVSVNGQVVLTDGNGFFSMAVPEVSNRRYILNISKFGLMAMSKVYFRDATGIDYNLVPNTTGKFSGGEEIVLIEEEDNFTRFERQTPLGTMRRSPAQVIIPPNSIVDENGEPFNGQLFASLRTIDLLDQNELMPGDGGGLRKGEDVTLESFGAIDVQLRDANNPDVKLQLDPEREAQISIPITSLQEPDAGDQIDLWDYDTELGLWIYIGVMQREGDAFVGTTNMFSTLNADVTFTDAACLEIRDNPSAPMLGGGASVKLVFQIPTTTGIPKVKTTTVTSADMPLFVVRLPPNENVAMTVIKLPSLDTTKIQLLFTGPPNPGPASLNPSTGDCKIFYLDVPVIDSTVFLNRVNNDSLDGIQYYNSIGAMTAGSPNFTLASWKTAFGFGGGADTEALYYNAGDLGFWRAMFYKTSGGTNAFYVTNYANDFDALAQSAPIATVCMEFSPLPGGTADVTKFYVFDANGNLVNNADLDGNGAKFIPNLCALCHGGKSALDYSTLNSTTLETAYTDATLSMPNFLHFDVESFAYSTATGYLRSDQESELRDLNQAALDTKVTDAIEEFVMEAYGESPPYPANLPAVNFIDHTLVPDWDVAGTGPGGLVTHRDFYPEVVATSCRVCHIARPQTFYWFNDINQISFGPVCNTTPTMPNAQVTFKNFWTDSTRVRTFRDYFGLTTINCPDP